MKNNVYLSYDEIAEIIMALRARIRDNNGHDEFTAALLVKMREARREAA